MTKLNRIDVVSVGPWNPRIFTPSWVSEILKGCFTDFKQGELAAEVNFDDLVIGFVFRKLKIKPTYQSLIFEIEDLGPEFIQSTSKFCKTIFQMLGNTPIKGVGVNFHFRADEKDSKKINQLFSEQDYWGQKLHPVSFRLNNEEKEYLTNISLVRKPAGNGITINFHYEITSFAPKFEVDAYKLINDHQKEAEAIVL